MANPNPTMKTGASPTTETAAKAVPAVAAAAAKGVPAAAANAVDITVTVNGREHHARVEPRLLLVHFLRENLGLTGTNVGCDTSQCGACAVLLDGAAVKSCTLLAVQADRARITTIEGLAAGAPSAEGMQAKGLPAGGRLHPLQEAFWEHHGLQCGYCTPGMILAAYDLLQHNPTPSNEEIRHALEGNFCRCTGYHNIVAAVHDAAIKMAARPTATAS